MASFSPLPPYILGGLCFGLTIHGFLFPAAEYSRFGLPLDRPRPKPRAAGDKPITADEGEGTVSPLIHMKSLRELAFGSSIIAFQYQGNEAAVTTMIAVMSTSGLGDGIVVWLHGGEGLRKKAFGHWAAFAGLVAWAWWRAQSQ